MEIEVPRDLMVSRDDSDSDSDDSYIPETRGRNEIELKEYREHVSIENKKNDDEIKSLRKSKEKAPKKKQKSFAAKIARAQREKTTRSRRLRDKERSNIHETILDGTLALVGGILTETKGQKVSAK
jgi:hypothetical protein